MKKSEFIQKVLQKVPEYTKLEVEQLLEVFEQLGMVQRYNAALSYQGEEIFEWDIEDEEKTS